MEEDVVRSEGSEPLEPDAVILPGEGQEGRNVNADDAYPALQSVNVRGLFRRYLRGGGRGGSSQQTSKQRGEREPRR
jgi:hypothetical protein